MILIIISQEFIKIVVHSVVVASRIIVFKVIIGIVVGLIVDLIYKRKETNV